MSANTHPQTAPEDRISLKQKTAYAVGMLVNNLQAAALPAIMVILNLGLGMDALWVAIIGAVPRIFDAISDPMVGYLSDNTRSRWGRRRPFIMVGALLSGFIFAIMWQVPLGFVDLETRESQQGFVAPQMEGLADFPVVELNLDIPTPATVRVEVHEEGPGAEIFTQDLTWQSPDSEDGRLYRFNWADMQGSGSGDGVLDMNALGHISLSLVGTVDPAAMTVESVKLKKDDAFFIRYFWYFLGMFVLFILCYTLYATPFVAFGYEMTPDYHERTRLHAFANTMGQLAWVSVPWFWALMASDLFDNMVHGARVLAICVGVVVAVGGMVPALFTRERPQPPRADDEEQGKGFLANMAEFWQGIKITFRCKPFVKICGATFLVFNGFQLGMSFSLYIMIYYLFGGDNDAAGKLNGYFGSMTAILTMLVIPLTAFLASRLGKRRTFLLTISLSMVGYALKWVGYNPEHPYWLLMATPLVAFGTGSLFTLMGSMISDICDYDELKTHKRREGVFGAIYWWMVKVGMALALLLTGVMLKVAGFDVALGAAQSEKTLFMLRIFDVGIPIITSGVALVILASYSLSEDKVRDIRTQLEKRRGKISA